MRQPAGDCGALGESALPGFALSTDGDWPGIAARPEASPHQLRGSRGRSPSQAAGRGCPPYHASHRHNMDNRHLGG